jgi:mannose-6-phosphate isomerase-like protein (cupin superfamily)
MDLLAQTSRHAGDRFARGLAAGATSSEGEVALVERSAPEGFMPPLIRRSENETYGVIEGDVVFFVGDDMIWAGPGDMVVAPRGVPRTFRAASAGARWLVQTQVRSLGRFVDFGRAVSRPRASAGWPSPEERAAVASMGAVNGIELLGPPGALPERDSCSSPAAPVRARGA